MILLSDKQLVCDPMKIPLIGRDEKVNTQLKSSQLYKYKMNRLDALMNDIICSFYIFSRLSIFTGYQVLFENVSSRLGNMFLFCKKWISFYTHCVTPSQEDIHRVKAFDIRPIHSYQLYLGITPEGHGIE